MQLAELVKKHDFNRGLAGARKTHKDTDNFLVTVYGAP
jgi:hypothetical protein